METPNSAVERLFAEYERELGRFLVQIVGVRALAEDLLQETFETALREDLDAIDNVRAWLYAVARNRALHALRSRRRAESALQLLAGRLRGAQTSDPAEALAVRDLLERCLGEDDRVILVLRHLHGFDGPELARILDVSPEAARQRLVRARRRLLEALEKPGGLTATAEPRPEPGSPTELLFIQRVLAPLAELAPATRSR